MTRHNDPSCSRGHDSVKRRRAERSVRTDGRVIPRGRNNAVRTHHSRAIWAEAHRVIHTARCSRSGRKTVVDSKGRLEWPRGMEICYVFDVSRVATRRRGLFWRYFLMSYHVWCRTDSVRGHTSAWRTGESVTSSCSGRCVRQLAVNYRVGGLFKILLRPPREADTWRIVAQTRFENDSFGTRVTTYVSLQRL